MVSLAKTGNGTSDILIQLLPQPKGFSNISNFNLKGQQLYSTTELCIRYKTILLQSQKMSLLSPLSSLRLSRRKHVGLPMHIVISIITRLYDPLGGLIKSAIRAARCGIEQSGTSAGGERSHLAPTCI